MNQTKRKSSCVAATTAGAQGEILQDHSSTGIPDCKDPLSGCAGAALICLSDEVSDLQTDLERAACMVEELCEGYLGHSQGYFEENLWELQLGYGGAGVKIQIARDYLRKLSAGLGTLYDRLDGALEDGYAKQKAGWKE